MKKISIILSTVLAGVLVLAGAFVTVKMAPVKAATHENHCICGGERNGVGDHVCDETAPTWTPVSVKGDLTGLAGVGKASTGNSAEHFVYLENDITLTANLSLYSGTKLHICLNGHKLIGGTDTRVFVTTQATAAPAVLTICDCSEGETGVVQCKGSLGATSSNTLQGHGVLIYGKNSDFKLFGGTIQDGKTNYNFGANLAVGNGATAEIYGGTIKNGTVANTVTGNPYGGNIGVSSGTVVTMYGGLVENGNGYKWGGNVGSPATGTAKFILNGGTLKGGNAWYGGSVCVANFEMNGGVIDGGTATKSGSSGGFGGNVGCRVSTVINGGTVKNGHAVGSSGGNFSIWNTAGRLTINGGLITGGIADDKGGEGGIAVFYEAADDCFQLNGGTITGNKGGVSVTAGSAIISGNPVVKDNEKLNFTYSTNVHATSALTGGELYFSVSPREQVVESTVDNSAYIFNDNAGYVTYYDTETQKHGFKFVAPDHDAASTHCICGDSEEKGDGHVCTSVTWTQWTSTTTLPTVPGNYYLTNDINLGDATVTLNGDMAICLANHTITGNKQVTVNGTLTLSDCTTTVLNKVKATGKTMLHVTSPVEDTLFKAQGEGAVYSYDVIHSNTDMEKVVDILNDTDNANREIDIYLISGQSNAAGTSLLTSAKPGEHDYNVYNNVHFYELRKETDGKIVSDWTGYEPVREGMGYDKAHIGPELGMAQILNDLYKTSDRQAIILKSAAGGTSILMHQDETGKLIGTYGTDTVNRFNSRGSWYPEALQSEDVKALGENRATGFLTRQLLRSVREVYEDLLGAGYKLENIHIVSMNWMQGETDRQSAGSYKTTFPILVDEIRTGISDITGQDYSELPFVMGEIASTFNEATPSSVETNYKFIAMQHELADEMANVEIIPTAEFLMNVYENGQSIPVGSDFAHWSYADIQVIGNMFALKSLGEDVVGPEKPEPEEPDAHKHCVCGGALDGVGDHVCGEEAEWQPIATFAELLALPGMSADLPSGTTTAEYYVYLENDITATQAVGIRSGVKIHICLNGHTWTGANNTRIMHTISASSGALISISDCSEEETGVMKATGSAGSSSSTVQGGAICVYNKGSELQLYGGTIQDGHTNYNFGGNIAVCSNTTFKMYGGAVKNGIVSTPSTNSTNGSGGNVGLSGTGATFRMYGGTLENGNASSYGGNVSLGANATFSMDGGTITGGTAKWGGNIANSATNGNPMYITGGTIKDGVAHTSYGGNIGIFDNTNLTISGDTVITGGTAKSYGGNISMTANTAGKTPLLTITDNVEVSNGTAAIEKDANGYGGNIVLNRDGRMEMTGGKIYGGKAYLGGNICLTNTGNGQVNLLGGEIYNGDATANGWDVQNETLGTGVITIGGDVKIYNNLKHTGGGGVNTGKSTATIRIEGGTVKDRVMATSGKIYVSGGYIDGDLVNYTYEYVLEVTGGYFTKKPAAIRMPEGYFAADCTEAKDGTTYLYHVVEGVLITATSRTDESEDTVATISGGGMVEKGKTFTLTAPLQSGVYQFVGWYKNAFASENGVGNDLVYTGTAGDTDETYIAVYQNGRDYVILTVIGEKMDVTVDAYGKETVFGTYTKEVPVGAEIIVTFKGTKTFVFWTNESHKVVDTNATVTMHAYTDVTLNAETAYDETGAEVLFVSNTNQIVRVVNTEGALDASEIPGVPVRVGTTGGQWDKTLAEINELIASGAKHIEVKATGYSVVTEIYEELPEADHPVIEMTLTETTAQEDGRVTVSFGATRFIPENFVLVEQGILFVQNSATIASKADAEPVLFFGSKDAVKFRSSSTLLKDITVLNIKNVGEGKKVFAKGYMVVKEQDSDELQVLYTEVFGGSLSGIE